MKPDTLAKLTGVEHLPGQLQRLIWNQATGYAYSSLFARSDLDPELVELALEARNVSALTAWIRSADHGSNLELLTRVGLALTDPYAMACLAGADTLPPALLEHVLDHATGSAADVLLRRSDLNADQRARMAVVYVQGLSPQVDSSPTQVRELLGRDPDVWAAVLPHCATLHPGLLAHVPYSDDPRVHEAAVRALEALFPPGYSEQKPATERSDVRIARATARRLLASPFITHDRMDRIDVVAARVGCDIVELLEQRRQLDGETLLAGAFTCTGEPSHVQHLKDLIDATSVLEVSPAELAIEACRHRAELSAHQSDRAISGARGTLTPTVLRRLEDQHGPGSEPVLAAVQLFGVHTVRELRAPELVVRSLAQAGWSHVVTARLEPRLDDVMVEHYHPAVDLLRNTYAASRVVERVGTLPPAAQETAWTLLDEWSGTLPELLQAALHLSSQ